MFDDIGKKIMDWMKWVCIVGWIFVVVDLIGEIAIISDMGWRELELAYGTDSNGTAIFLAILGAVGKLAAVYVGTWILYGFGQLVDDVHEMRTKDAPMAVTVSMDGEKKVTVTKEQPDASKEAKWRCAKCGAENPLYKATCQGCGADKFSRPGSTASSGPKWRCPKCGTENSNSRVSCQNCGAYK